MTIDEWTELDKWIKARAWMAWIGKSSAPMLPPEPATEPLAPLILPALPQNLPDPIWRMPEVPKCECGAGKVGVANNSPGHSDWCPVRKQ